MTRWTSVDQRAPNGARTGLPGYRRLPSTPLLLPLSTSRLGLLSTHDSMNRGARGRLHAGKEGSGTLGGKAGRSRDAIPGNGTVYRLFTFHYHHHFSLRLRSLLYSFSCSPDIHSTCLPLNHFHHQSTASAQWQSGLHVMSQHLQVAGGRWHVRTAWRLLGHGRKC